MLVPALAQARDETDNQIKAISVSVAAKTKLFEERSAVSASAQIEAAKTQKEARTAAHLAADSQAKAAEAQERRDAAQMRQIVAQREAEEAQRDAMTAEEANDAAQTRAAALQTQAMESQARDDVAQIKAKEMQVAVVAVDKEIERIAQVLLPLTQALGFTRVDPCLDGTAGPGSKKRQRPGDSAQRVVLVESDSLDDVLAMMDASLDPAIYDFQGRSMTCKRTGDLTVLHDGVTWRNGSITSSASLGLRVESSGFVLQSVVMIGGYIGVLITSGGAASMEACEVRGSHFGVRITGTGSLVAKGLKVLDCSHHGLHLEGHAFAEITDCEVSGSNLYGVCVAGNSKFVGSNMKIVGSGMNAVAVMGAAATCVIN